MAERLLVVNYTVQLSEDITILDLWRGRYIVRVLPSSMRRSVSRALQLVVHEWVEFWEQFVNV